LLILLCGFLIQLPQLAARNASIPRVGKPTGLQHFEDMKPHGAATYLPKISGFTQQQLSDGKPATQPTDVYLGYDLIRLYVVWVAGIHHIHPDGAGGDVFPDASHASGTDHRRAEGWHRNSGMTAVVMFALTVFSASSLLDAALNWLIALGILVLFRASFTLTTRRKHQQ
jgi:hypothetical protein